MRAFLEQYGIAMFTLVVVMIMTLMSSGLGNYIESLLVKEITELTEKGGLQTDKALSGTSDDEEKPGHVMITGQEFNDLIPTSTTSIEFLSTAAPASATIDVSEAGDGSIMAWSEGTTFYVAPKETDHLIYANPDSSYMFNMGYSYDGDIFVDIYLESINFSNFDTSKVTNMDYMFKYATNEQNSSDMKLIGIENWNTSNVTSMEYMFYSTCYWNEEVKLDLSKWNVSKVTNMQGLFYMFGERADKFDLTGLEKWDTLNVTDMSSMFGYTGFFAENCNISNISNWNVSNVTDMSYMFTRTAFCSTNFDLDLSNWNVSNVTDMSYMFYATADATNVETFKLNLSNWDTSHVKNMNGMFNQTSRYSNQFELIGLENWDTSNVTDMNIMFDETGKTAGFTPPSWY